MAPSPFIVEWHDYWSGIDADIRITLGIEPVEIDADHTLMRMPFAPEIAQATGLFSAGALIQLADVAATWLALVHLRASGAPDGSFPFAIHLGSSLVGNTDHGDAIAHARITSAGRTVVVTQTEVRADDDRLLLAQTGTHVVRSPRR